MNILLTGGTGLIGNSWLQSRPKDTFTILTRQANRLPSNGQVNYIADLQQLNSLDDFDLVVNLAGEPIIGKRWADNQKKIIRSSRVDTTLQLADLFLKSQHPPQRFISGSAIGIYGDTGISHVDEKTLIQKEANDFAQSLCLEWEAAALTTSEITSVCLLRTGIVLDQHQGALAKMLPAFKWGLGGKLGSGCQMMSWIHIKDAVRIMNYLVDDPDHVRVVNLTAPNPVTNHVFTKTLAKHCGKPGLISVPKSILKFALGESSQLLLDSQWVQSNVLQEKGFHFLFPDLDSALRDLLARE